MRAVDWQTIQTSTGRLSRANAGRRERAAKPRMRQAGVCLGHGTLIKTSASRLLYLQPFTHAYLSWPLLRSKVSELVCDGPHSGGANIQGIEHLWRACRAEQHPGTSPYVTFIARVLDREAVKRTKFLLTLPSHFDPFKLWQNNGNSRSQSPARSTGAMTSSVTF